MKKTLLIGNFGARNVGDEIILWTTLKKYPNSVVMTADEDFSRRFLQIPERENIFVPPFPTGLRSLKKFFVNRQYREKITNLSHKTKIEQVVFAGGGLLAIKWRAYLLWGMMRNWVNQRFPRAKVVFLHQGVDQTRNIFKKFIIKFFFKKANKISVRDQISLDFLQTLGIKAELDDDAVEKFFKEEGAWSFDTPREPKHILVNACRPVPAKFWSKIKTKSQQLNQKIVFICFEPRDACNVPKNFAGEVVFPENISEVWEIFQKTSLAIGQRLHFLILANQFVGSTKTYLLDKPYAQKTKNFAKKYGLQLF